MQQRIQHIVFIDPGVEHSHLLTEGIEQSAEVIRLDERHDAVSQITAVIASC